MIHTTMWTYPWDVIDEGVDRVIGSLKEEVGLDAISLSTVYHTYDQLRTHMPGKKLFSGYEDAIYFPAPERAVPGHQDQAACASYGQGPRSGADYRRGLSRARFGTDFVDCASAQPLHG